MLKGILDPYDGDTGVSWTENIFVKPIDAHQKQCSYRIVKVVFSRFSA